MALLQITGYVDVRGGGKVTKRNAHCYIAAALITVSDTKNLEALIMQY